MSEQQPKNYKDSQAAFMRIMLNGEGRMTKPFPPEYTRGRQRGFEHFRESPEYKTLKFLVEEIYQTKPLEQVLAEGWERMNAPKAKKPVKAKP